MEPEVKAAIITVFGTFFGSIIIVFFGGVFLAWVTAGPDFSISFENTSEVFYCVGESSYIITIHNDREFRGFNSYVHSISLAASNRNEGPLPNGMKIDFQPPDLWFNGNHSVISHMTISITSNFIKHNKSDETISIFAFGGDGRKRSCSFPLKYECNKTTE